MTITTPSRGFTEKWLKSLPKVEKRLEIPDNGAKGLRLRVSPGGAKTFVWMYRHNGKVNRLTLGRYGTGEDRLTLAEARARLLQAREQLDMGITPALGDDAPDTVKALAEDFFLIKKRQLKRPERMRQVIDHDILPIIGNKKIKAVTRLNCSAVVEKVVNRGAPAHAGTVLDALKQMFDYAESKGFVENSPAAHIKPRRIGVARNVKDRALDYDPDHEEIDESLKEIRAFWHALNKAPRMSKQIRSGLKILLLTGVRTGELRLAQWEHIDYDKKLWSIPASNTKNNKAWKVPLTDPVIEMLKELEEDANGSKWVMASASAKGHIEDKAMARALKRLFSLKDENDDPVLDIDSFSPHDLRRTLRTHLSHLGIPPHVSEKCLNHSLGKIFGTYDKHPFIEERREALDKWTNTVLDAVGGK
jgi:integrase